MAEERGEAIHGEVSSADASAGVASTLYAAGETDERVLASTETLVVTDMLIAWDVGGSVVVASDTDDAGKRIFKGTVGASGGVFVHLQVPFYCPRGTKPKVIADAGQIDVQFSGYILRG